MQLIVRNTDNRVMYAREVLSLSQCVQGEGLYDPTLDTTNATLQTATPPADFVEYAWSYKNGVWAVLDQGRIDAHKVAERKARVPASVSRRQFKQALTRSGKRAMVEAAIAAANQDTKDWYIEATDFQPTHPAIAPMAAALGITDEEIDNLFILAGGL